MYSAKDWGDYGNGDKVDGVTCPSCLKDGEIHRVAVRDNGLSTYLCSGCTTAFYEEDAVRTGDLFFRGATTNAGVLLRCALIMVGFIAIIFVLLCIIGRFVR